MHSSTLFKTETINDCFTGFSTDSPLWIFIADREFSKEEQDSIDFTLKTFFASWQAHGAALKATSTLFKQQVLLVGIDNSIAQATGCSKDKLFGLIKELEEQLGVNLTNRLRVATLSDQKIHTYMFSDLKEKILNASIADHTLILDGSIAKVGQLNRFIMPIHSSWISNVL